MRLSSTLRALRIGLVMAGLCAATVARADDATPTPADAKRHYNAATAHFAVGEFAEAGEEYNKAYKAKPDAAFLYNAAQSFRLAGANERALVLYKNYLHFYPHAPNLDEVRTQIDKLTEAIEATNNAKTNPPMNTAEPGRPTPEGGTEVRTESTTTTPVTVTPVVATTAPPPDKPIYKKGWFWGVVAGAVVVVAVVVTVGVIEGSSTKSWNNAPPFGPGSQNGLSTHGLTVRF